MAAWAMASLPFINTTSSAIILNCLLIYFHFIHRDTSVGTNGCARRASVTSVFFHLKGIVVAFHVYLFVEGDYIERTGYHAQAASFAALRVDYDCSFNFCHNLLFYYVIVIISIY